MVVGFLPSFVGENKSPHIGKGVVEDQVGEALVECQHGGQGQCHKEHLHCIAQDIEEGKEDILFHHVVDPVIEQSEYEHYKFGAGTDQVHVAEH